MSEVGAWGAAAAGAEALETTGAAPIAGRIAAGSPRLRGAPDIDTTLDKRLGARSWDELEGTSEIWHVERLDTGVVYLTPLVPRQPRGVSLDLSRREELPPGTEPEAIARRLLERLGEAARDGQG